MNLEIFQPLAAATIICTVWVATWWVAGCVYGIFSRIGGK